MSKEIVIKNARLWPSVDRPTIEGGSLLVRDGRIAALGKPGRDIDAPSADTIDARNMLVMPGLIQGHVHLCQTIFRGIAEDLQLLPWLRKYIWPLEAAHHEASLKASARLACAEMIRTGTTAFMSMETVHNTQHVFSAVEETGMMGIIGHCFMDETGSYAPLCVPLSDGLALCDDLLRQWGDHDRLRLAVAPRFALSCTADNMRTCAEYARDHNCMLHTHSSEQKEEIKWVKQQTGMDNVDYLHDVGLTGPDVGLAHCVHTNRRERTIMVQTDTRVLHCPSANFKLGSGIAPIPEYLKLGLAVAIGADGAPCNNRMDAFLEMREAGLAQKPRLGADAMPARDCVRMATSLGAKALGWESEMGTLDVGKRANLIMVDQDTLHCLPSDDPATNLVYSNLGSDVQMTMINGEIVYEQGELKTIDEEKLRHDVKAERKALMERAGLR